MSKAGWWHWDKPLVDTGVSKIKAPAPIEFKRDTSNAVALGMVIGGMLVNSDYADPDSGEATRPESWRNIGWDQIVADVDRAAEALDRYQVNPGIDWDITDWYMTLDQIAMAVWTDPNRDWRPPQQVADCLVPL